MSVQPQARNLPVVVVVVAAAAAAAIFVVVTYLTLAVHLSCATSVVKMACSLTKCTKQEQRTVIGIVGLKCQRSEIHRRLSAQCGDNVLSQRRVYESIDTFRGGQTNVSDEDRSGRPSTSTTEGNAC